MPAQVLHDEVMNRCNSIIAHRGPPEPELSQVISETGPGLAERPPHRVTPEEVPGGPCVLAWLEEDLSCNICLARRHVVTHRKDRISGDQHLCFPLSGNLSLSLLSLSPSLFLSRSLSFSLALSPSLSLTLITSFLTEQISHTFCNYSICLWMCFILQF